MPVKIIDAGHKYWLTNNESLSFIKKEKGELVYFGTTNEELLEILIDRTKYLDAQFPCVENKAALEAMQKALDAFLSRTAKRVEQGVEGKDLNHESITAKVPVEK